MTVIREFSVAVMGNGQMLSAFVDKLKNQFSHVTVYDRNQEAVELASELGRPGTPSVADFDAIFSKNGAKETLTLRSFHRHRYFNYDLDDNSKDSHIGGRLLASMMQAVNEMLEPPPPRPVQIDNRQEADSPGMQDSAKVTTNSRSGKPTND